MLISLDHGNKLTKSLNKVFVSGLSESNTYPPFGGDVVKYKDIFYTLSSERFPYMRDKTTDDRFFVLTLFGIAYELEKASVYSLDNILEIEIAAGLPPAHFGVLNKKFESYIKSDGDIVEFEFNKKPYAIYISRVEVYPQALAAAMLIYGQIKEYPKVTVVDIGGFTVDYPK